MPEITATDRQLQALTGELRLLEKEYTLYFAGRSPRPPVENRSRFEQSLKKFERAPFDTHVQRFRFATLQGRYSSLTDLWDRGVRAREEGRPGPFGRSATSISEGKHRPATQVVHTASFADPANEADALHDLYNALMDARHQAGHGSVPFHRFANLVKQQVALVQQRHDGRVAFRVSLSDGKVRLTAKALRDGAERT